MKFALLGAVAVAASALVVPAKAQQVISDPGYCAQFYPDANCQNLGPGNPYTDGGYQAGAYANDMGPEHRHHAGRVYHHH
jgi:hypothetical protein